MNAHRAIVSEPPIDWTAEVVLIQPEEPPSLRMTRTVMTLGEAVEAILAMPHDSWTRSGIGLHAPVLMILDGRPIAQGYLSGHAARILAHEHLFPQDR
jgi:hypothetical protein